MLRRGLLIAVLFPLAGCGAQTTAGAAKSGSIGGPELILLGVGAALLFYFFRRRHSPTDGASPEVQGITPARTQVPAKEPAPSFRIRLRQQEKRVPVAVEVVKVPTGVAIAVKRTRTVEHSVEVRTGHRAECEVESDLLVLLRTSVRGEIERQLGRTYKETSSTEYEVKLNGAKCAQYKLVWVDVWILGEAVSVADGVVPFQFRDRAELEVVAVE